MRTPSEQHVKYLGYGKPSTKEEVDLEIIGLEQAIGQIKYNIADLKRKAYLADKASEKGLKSVNHLFGGSHENVQSKAGEEERDREGN